MVLKLGISLKYERTLSLTTFLAVFPIHDQWSQSADQKDNEYIGVRYAAFAILRGGMLTSG